MGEILGMASTHWPLLIQPDAGHLWPFQMTMNRLRDFPEEKKPISAWPEAARVEFGEGRGGFGPRRAPRQAAQVVPGDEGRD